MREKINTLRHLSVLILTLVIFFLGVLIGGKIEDKRVEMLYTQLQDQDLEYQSVVTEAVYLESLVSKKEEGKNVSCDLLKGSFYTSIANLDDSRIKLESYVSQASVLEEEYWRLQGHYMNTQVQYWILAEKISGFCGGTLNTILFFYDDKKECPACEDQGVYLDYVKKKLGDEVLIFSFDSKREGVVQLLAQKYDVFFSDLPVLVVNDEVMVFSSSDLIFEKLCEQGYDGEVCLE